MKRVSFSVAKALKEAGYPQYGYCDSYYDFDGHLVSKFCNIEKLVYPATFVMEAWLWLIREKGINLSAIYWNSDKSWHIAGFIKDKFNDPEDAIEKAIEFIVEHNLIK